MSRYHLVVGAGPVGRHVAALLVERGEQVILASRSGRDTGLQAVRHLALDAADADALTRAAEGAAVLYNCANPANYTQWERVWPPLAASMLTAVQASGAVYAITDGLYAYGPVHGPIREGLPESATDHKGVLRAKLWAQALAAHQAGRIRTVQVRASDFVGPGIGTNNGHVTRVLPARRFRGPRPLRHRADTVGPGVPPHGREPQRLSGAYTHEGTTWTKVLMQQLRARHRCGRGTNNFHLTLLVEVAGSRFP